MPESHEQYRFSLRDIAYAVSLLAISMGALGGIGLIFGSCILLAWVALFTSRGTILEFAVVIFVLGVLIALLLPAIHSGSEFTTHRRNLIQIHLALREYEDALGQLPPPYLTDRAGNPAHSWRVLILPFLGEDAIYNEYRFDEPWNSSHNTKIADQMPDVYHSPARDLWRDNSPVTSYLAIVGEETLWHPQKKRQLSQIADGDEHTALLIDANSKRVHWMQPKDITMQEAVDLITTKELPSGSRFWNESFFYVAARFPTLSLVDEALLINPVLPPEEAIAVLQDNDGHVLSEQIRNTRGRWSHSQLRLDNCLRAAIFFLTALLPVYWLPAHIRRIKAAKRSDNNSTDK